MYRSSMEKSPQSITLSEEVDLRRSYGIASITALCALIWLLVTFGLLSGDALFASGVTGAVVLEFFLLRMVLGKTLRLGQLNLPSFFLLVYLVILFIPAIFRFLDMTNPIRYAYLIAMESVLVTYPMGVGIANILLYGLSGKQDTQFTYYVIRTKFDYKVVPLFVIVLFLSAVILLLTAWQSPYIPLAEAIGFKSSSIDSVRLRFTITEMPKVLQYAFELVRTLALPACATYAYLMLVLYGDYWKRIFPVLFLFSLSATAFSLDRGPIVAQFAMILIARSLVRVESLKSLLKAKPVLAVISSMIAAGSISVLQYGGSLSVHKILNDAWYVFSVRIFDPAYMASLAFQEYNYDFGFLYGRSVRLFSMLSGREYVESLARIAVEVGPVSFIGDLWRQWGWSGVILGGISLGCVHQFVDRQFLSGTYRNIMSITAHALLLSSSVMILYGNLFGIMSVSLFGFSVLASAFAQRLFSSDLSLPPNSVDSLL